MIRNNIFNFLSDAIYFILFNFMSYICVLLYISLFNLRGVCWKIGIFYNITILSYYINRIYIKTV